VKAGKESYRIVGAFDQFEYCVHGLNRVKSDLEVLREEHYQSWKKNLLDV